MGHNSLTDLRVHGQASMPRRAWLSAVVLSLTGSSAFHHTMSGFNAVARRGGSHMAARGSGPKPGPKPSGAKGSKVAIIGGGVSGLACGKRLQELGMNPGESMFRWHKMTCITIEPEIEVYHNRPPLRFQNMLTQAYLLVLSKSLSYLRHGCPRPRWTVLNTCPAGHGVLAADHVRP